MRKVLSVLTYAFTMFACATLLAVAASDKVYIGLKYSFRTFCRNGEVVLVDPFSRTAAFYNLESKTVTRTISPFGNFVIALYEVPDGFLVVDRGEPSVFKMRATGQIVRRVSLPRRALSSTFVNNTLYVLLEGGAVLAFTPDLSQTMNDTFRSSPAYVFSWNNRLLATFLWNDGADFQFIGEAPREVGLVTPSLLVGDFLVDTRGGQLYNLRTGKLVKLRPYISSVHYDGKHYYVASMSVATVYKLDDEKVLTSFQVPFTPTVVRKVGDAIVVLSSASSKVMVSFDERNVGIYESGEYPIEVFAVTDGFAVYCSDSGEFWYYRF